MPMLNGTLSLHDVRDVEAAAHRVAEDWLRQKRAYLREHHKADLVAYLIAIAYELSLNHKPEVSSFSQRFYRTGSLRITDWYRSEFQDLRSPKPELALSLDGPATETTDGTSLTLIETLADQASPSDPTAQLDSDSLVGRIHAARHRYPTSTDALMGGNLQSGTRTPPNEPDDRRRLSEVRKDRRRTRTTTRAA
jgi:hypothetical protein